jgi:hypothetical protein
MNIHLREGDIVEINIVILPSQEASTLLGIECNHPDAPSETPLPWLARGSRLMSHLKVRKYQIREREHFQIWNANKPILEYHNFR